MQARGTEGYGAAENLQQRCCGVPHGFGMQGNSKRVSFGGCMFSPSEDLSILKLLRNRACAHIYIYIHMYACIQLF